MPQQQTIRDELEADAWRNHWFFARRCARKRRGHWRGPDRRPLKWQDRALLILSAVLLLLLIVRIETARADGTGEAFYGLEFQNPAESRRTVAMNTDILVEVTGLTARIEVTQAFSNTGDGWAEAIYRFPLPWGSAVDRLQVTVGDRVLEGEIREKETARRQYRQAKSSGRTASLVEQQRDNQFETRLANIAPGDDIRVTISFLALVDYRDGTFSLQIPLTFTPRWEGAGQAADPLVFARIADPAAAAGQDDHHLSIDIDLRSGMSLARLESRYHDVDIHPSLDGYRVFLADPDTRTDRVFELNWVPDFGSVPVSTLSTFNDGEAVYALLMLAPPLAEAISPRPREVVFVIDTSGSMEGESLAQAKAALKLGLTFLGPDDHFNLIRFSSDSERLFTESAPARPSYLEEAIEFIDDLSANGGTVMAPALVMALGLPAQHGLLRQVVFVTDGSVGNEQELLLQVAEDLGESRLFTVSIGPAPNTWFMRKTAEIGRGSHTHIGQLEEVEERIGGLWSRIENPAIQNVCVDWGMAAEFYPEVIPDLYAGEPLWLTARLPFEPGEVSVCGDLDGRFWEMQTRLATTQGSENLAMLWARSKVEALEDSRVFGSDPQTVQSEILDLALKFGLLTRYTSLVAVDRTPTRPASEPLGIDHVPSLLPQGAGMHSGFSSTATGWLAQCLLAIFSLVLATAMLLYRPRPRGRELHDDRSPVTPSLQ